MSGDYTGIIDRVEYLRTSYRMPKAEFARHLGISPQTYNNFTGLQRSRPNIDLIMSVVEKFNVDPRWLLWGEGTIAAPDRMSNLEQEKAKCEECLALLATSPWIQDSSVIVHKINGRLVVICEENSLLTMFRDWLNISSDNPESHNNPESEE